MTEKEKFDYILETLKLDVNDFLFRTDKKSNISEFDEIKVYRRFQEYIGYSNLKILYSRISCLFYCMEKEEFKKFVEMFINLFNYAFNEKEFDDYNLSFEMLLQCGEVKNMPYFKELLKKGNNLDIDTLFKILFSKIIDLTDDEKVNIYLEYYKNNCKKYEHYCPSNIKIDSRGNRHYFEGYTYFMCDREIFEFFSLKTFEFLREIPTNEKMDKFILQEYSKTTDEFKEMISEINQREKNIEVKITSVDDRIKDVFSKHFLKEIFDLQRNLPKKYDSEFVEYYLTTKKDKFDIVLFFLKSLNRISKTQLDKILNNLISCKNTDYIELYLRLFGNNSKIINYASDNFSDKSIISYIKNIEFNSNDIDKFLLKLISCHRKLELIILFDETYLMMYKKKILEKYFYDGEALFNKIVEDNPMISISKVFIILSLYQTPKLHLVQKNIKNIIELGNLEYINIILTCYDIKDDFLIELIVKTTIKSKDITSMLNLIQLYPTRNNDDLKKEVILNSDIKCVMTNFDLWFYQFKNINQNQLNILDLEVMQLIISKLIESTSLDSIAYVYKYYGDDSSDRLVNYLVNVLEGTDDVMEVYDLLEEIGFLKVKIKYIRSLVKQNKRALFTKLYLLGCFNNSEIDEKIYIRFIVKATKYQEMIEVVEDDQEFMRTLKELTDLPAF